MENVYPVQLGGWLVHTVAEGSEKRLIEPRFRWTLASSPFSASGGAVFWSTSVATDGVPEGGADAWNKEKVHPSVPAGRPRAGATSSDAESVPAILEVLAPHGIASVCWANGVLVSGHGDEELGET